MGLIDCPGFIKLYEELVESDNDSLDSEERAERETKKVKANKKCMEMSIDGGETFPADEFNRLLCNSS